MTAPARRAADYAEAFVRGPAHLGRGAGGVGIYTTEDADTARQYAGNGGVVVRAVPLAGARLVGVEELLARRAQELATLTEREQRSLRVLTEDPGRLAAALGYDAVRYPDGTVLVVNRTALAVEEP
ncbi:hypothetical protein [Actinomycetospora termitidis]|uniref:Uncharacterized protein n=1 Tax=Actinomycetospora termitidis TaxID=3053470 RepID=A0ABT7MFH1_9PSEU|nr:hypothetical protein [Actinomycetospora sp. Odt1-22]MDL5159420.1 hypothetical protein [Actinomycetospora sp. Odt1-22]